MAGRAKTGSIFIKLVSGAGTGFHYTTVKTPKNTPHKLQLMKFDPFVNKHVLFKEEKISRKRTQTRR